MSISAEHLPTVPELSNDTTSLEVSVLRTLESQCNRRDDDSQYQLQAHKTAIPLVVGEVACIVGSVLISYCIASALPFSEINRWFSYLFQFALTGLMIFSALSLYPAVGPHPACELGGLTISAVAVSACSTAAARLIGPSQICLCSVVGSLSPPLVDNKALKFEGAY